MEDISFGENAAHPGEAMTTVNGCVYAYTNSNGVVVYVGQTRQALAARDRAHRRDTQTPFDRSYDEDGKYIMRVIESKTIEFSNADNEKIAMSVVCDWMDTMEEKYIHEYKTYESGLNFTRGGQWGSAWAIAQAAEKRRYENFRDVYMPLFRAHGNCKRILQTTPTIGWVASAIRQGQMKVPIEFQDELFNERQLRTANVRIDDAREHFDLFLATASWWRQNRGDDLGSMPRMAVIPDDVPNIGGVTVGEALHKYREGRKAGNYDWTREEPYSTSLQELGYTDVTTLSAKEIRQRAARTRTNNTFEKMVPLLIHVFNERGHVNMKQGEDNPELPDHMSRQLASTNYKRVASYIHDLRNTEASSRLTPDNLTTLRTLNFFDTTNELYDFMIVQGLLYYYQTEKYSYPQQGYKLPVSDDVPPFLRGAPLGVWVDNRRRRETLPHRAQALIAVYNHRERPSTSECKKVAIRARQTDGDAWQGFEDAATAAEALKVSKDCVLACLRGQYATQGWQFRYVDETREPVRRAKAKGDALKKRGRCENNLGRQEFQSLGEVSGFLNRNAATVIDAIKKRRRINGFTVEYVSTVTDNRTEICQLRKKI